MRSALDSRRRFYRIWTPRTGLHDGCRVRRMTRMTLFRRAILRAFRGFESLRGSDVKAWLLTIVRNCHSTALKQQQRRAFEPLPDEHDAQDGYVMIATTADPESASIRRDDKRTLDRLMSALPEEHREVLVLREIEDLDYREIGMVTNVPIGTVMSRLARARAAL